MLLSYPALFSVLNNQLTSIFHLEEKWLSLKLLGGRSLYIWLSMTGCLSFPIPVLTNSPPTTYSIMFRPFRKPKGRYLPYPPSQQSRQSPAAGLLGTPEDLQQEAFYESHNLPAARMQELLDELTQHNAAGHIVTYCRDRSGWKTWERQGILIHTIPDTLTQFDSYRPRRQFRHGGSTPVAASGFKKIRNLNLPTCPHAHNGFRLEAYSKMHVHQAIINGVEEWVFRADHNCPFIGIFFPSKHFHY